VTGRSAARGALAGLLLAGSFSYAYWDVLRWLSTDWDVKADYSHGFLVPPVALFLTLERRRQFVDTPKKPSSSGGLLLLGISVGLLVLGTLSSQFLSRISIVLTIAGIVVFMWGWKHLRILAFPIAFLLLMIPPPDLLMNRLTSGLQLVASAMAQRTMTATGIPVFRSGNILTLPYISLDVAEACSGIRSLVSIMTFGILYAYYTERTTWRRLVIVACTIPVATIANGFRVAGTGIAAHWYGAEAATSFFHTFSGLLLFLVVLATLPLFTWAMARLLGRASVPVAA
jgi:exosortase